MNIIDKLKVRTEEMRKKQKFQDRLNSYVMRCGAKTPPFFKKLRMIGMIVAAAGTAIVSAPIALPVVLVTIGGYLVAGGTVATAISQAAVQEDDCETEDNPSRAKAQ